MSKFTLLVHKYCDTDVVTLLAQLGHLRGYRDYLMIRCGHGGCLVQKHLANKAAVAEVTSTIDIFLSSVMQDGQKLEAQT